MTTSDAETTGREWKPMPQYAVWLAASALTCGLVLLPVMYGLEWIGLGGPLATFGVTVLICVVWLDRVDRRVFLPRRQS